MEIELRWIKAHVGHHGNELADEAAKNGALQAVRSGNIRPTKAFFKREIRERQLQDWNQKWISDPECRQTKLFYPEINRKESYKALKMNRKNISVYVRYVTGHNFLNRHNNLVDPSRYPTKLCRFCGEEEETSEHILTLCQRFSFIRYQTLESTKTAQRTGNFRS